MSENSSILKQGQNFQAQGDSAYHQGDVAAAVRAYEQALQLYIETQYVDMQEIVLFHLARCAQNQGQYGTTRRYYDQIVEKVHTLDLRHFMHTLEKLLDHMARYPTDTNADDLQAIIALYPRSNNRTQLFSQLSRKAFEYKNNTAVIVFVQQALAEPLNRDGWEVRDRGYRMELAELAAQAGDYDTARRVYERLAGVAESLQFQDSIRILWVWGRFEYSFGHLTEGLTLCQLAVVSAQNLSEDHATGTLSKIWIDPLYMQHEFSAMESNQRLPQDINERLETRLRLMTAEVSGASDALFLLQRMITFQVSLSWGIVRAIVPEEWSESRVRTGLRTLLAWRLVHHDQEAYDLYAVAAGLDALITPDPTLFQTVYDRIFCFHGDESVNDNTVRCLLIRKEWDAIQQAIAWGEEHNPRKALALMFAIDPYLKIESGFFPVLVLTPVSAETKRQQNIPLQSHVYIASPSKRTHNMTRTLELAERLEDVPAQARAARILGDWPYRPDMSLKALALYEQLGDESGQIEALKGLGAYAQLVNKFDEARTYYQRLLVLYERHARWHEHTFTTELLQKIQTTRPARPEINGTKTERALNDLQYKLADQTADGDIEGQVLTLIRIAEHEDKQANRAETLQALNQALALSETLSHRPFRREILRHLCSIARFEEDYSRYRALLTERLQWAEHTDAQFQPAKSRAWDDRIEILWEWGRFEYAQGQTAQGCRMCRTALTMLEQTQWWQIEARIASMRQGLAKMNCGDDA